MTVGDTDWGPTTSSGKAPAPKDKLRTIGNIANAVGALPPNLTNYTNKNHHRRHRA